MKTKSKKTETQKLQAVNAKANRKHKQDQVDTAELHNKVRAGEITAAAALKAKAGTTQSEKLAKQNGKANKKTAIMARTAPCVIEYDFKKDGVITRRQKHFDDAHAAKAFFVEKDVKGKKPMVLKTPVAPPAKPQAPTNTPKPRLKDVFPVDPLPAGHKPQLQATGDPTETKLDLNGNKPGALVPDQLTDAEIKAEAKKAAKQLKRKQKKGDLLWKQPDTKTVVAAKWQKPIGAFYDRWLIKYSDGTETLTSQLSVIHSREHKDHHLRVAGTPAIDQLTNKQYEEVLRRSAQYAQQQANRYKQGLANFRGTDTVQKEMDKRISKKALKQEAPLTPLEVELAKGLAEAANCYCVSPSAFFKTEEERSKSVHTAMLTDTTVQGIFEQRGIDKLACTIRIVQFARHLHSKMTPRLKPNGPQIGTPELAKQHEADAAKAKTVVVTSTDADGKVVTKVQSGDGVDKFGNRIKSGKGKINAEILAAAPGTLFTVELIDKIDAKTIATKSRTRRHFKKLSIKGFLVATPKGYRLADDPKAKGTAPAAPAKPAKAAKSKAKAANAKAGKKEPRKAAGKAKAGKAKAATKAKGKRRK